MNGPGLIAPTVNLLRVLVRGLIDQGYVADARDLIMAMREACDLATGEINAATKCVWCSQGNPRIQSSISEKFVQMSGSGSGSGASKSRFHCSIGSGSRAQPRWGIFLGRGQRIRCPG